MPHLERGTTVLEPRHRCDLSDRWGLGGIYTLTLNFQQYSDSFSSLQHAQNRAGALSLSLSIVDLKPSSKSIDFPINPWGKRVQNLIREQLHWFPNSKDHLVHVLVDGCVCYSWSLAPSRLEHRPVSLPSLWQHRKVCRHLLQRLKSPISRVHSLDLGTR